MTEDIKDFQRRLYANYKHDLDLPQPYHYLYGNPVQPVVPLDVAQHSVLILGAYPSARFAAVAGERDVPLADNCGPFSTERYFDGQRVRTVNSGAALEEAYLEPLGLRRDQCWITNLVRVFLFKPAHIDKYRRPRCHWPPGETRSQLEVYAARGLGWLAEELHVARPRIIITLGAEVAGLLQGVRGRKPRNELLGGDPQEMRVDGKAYPVIHLAHPGIVMRPATDRNPWPRAHRTEHIPVATEAVQKLL